MDFTQMQTLLEFYVDDVIDPEISIVMFNAAKDDMAAAVHARFPDLGQDVGVNDSFVFDSRFHEAPVLYAAAMVKAYDSSIGEKQDFMNQYQMKLRDFVKEYYPPIMYQDIPNAEHFTVTEDSDPSLFTITNESYSVYGNVEVYVNGRVAGYRRYGNQFTLAVPAPVGSTVTIVWEPYQYQAPQYLKGWW